MLTAIAAARVSAVVFVMGFGAWAVGCATKQIATTSGDHSAHTTEKTAGAPGPTEQVRQEPVAAIVETPASRPHREAPQPSGERAAAAPDTGTPSPGGPTLRDSAQAGVEHGGLASGDLSGLGDIYFDFDRYAIRRDAEPVLEANAAWMRQEPGKSVVIEGHCDERGTLAYNLVLGEQRARSAKRYLEDLGIPGSRLQIVSYGEVRPVCREHDEGCWKRNRRAHFVVR